MLSYVREPIRHYSQPRMSLLPFETLTGPKSLLVSPHPIENFDRRRIALSQLVFAILNSEADTFNHDHI